MRDRVEKKVLAALRTLEHRWHNSHPSDRESTAALMRVLERLGRSLRYHVNRRAPRRVHDGEWLFDMTWTQRRNAFLVDVPLVLECEWTPTKRDDDFDKLLVARAHHRVFVFYDHTAKRARTTVKSLVRRIRHSRLTKPHDQYVFAAWTDEPPYLLTWLYAGGSLTSA